MAISRTAPVFLVLLAGCRPGLPDEGSSSGDSAEACDQLNISGICFSAVDLNTAGVVALVADLDLNGDAELLLEIDGSLVLLDLDPGDSTPSFTQTEEKVGWMTSGDLTLDPGLEVITSSSAHAVTSVLGTTQDGFSTLYSAGEVLGPLGAIEMAGPSDGTWIVRTLPTFAAVGFEGGSWSDPKQSFIIPGCGLDWSSTQGDYNGDGRQDAAFMASLGPCDTHPEPDAPTPVLVLWSTDAGEVKQAERVTGSTLDRGSSGDVTGDGIDDLLAWRPGYDTAALLIGDGQDPLVQRIELTLESGQFIGVADLGGDGTDEIMLWKDSGVYALTDPYDTSSDVQLFEASDHSFTFADMNGDHVDDFIQTSSDRLVLTLSQVK